MEQVPVYIVTVGLAWVVSHSLKLIIARMCHGTSRNFFASGDMPSGHSATIVALAALIGLKMGFDSAIFALAGLMAIIVMYDAIHVRWSTGQNGRAINAIIKQGSFSVEKVEVNKGHTLAEVIAGGLLGVLIAVVVFITT